MGEPTVPAPTLALCGAGMIANVHALAAAELGLSVVAVASRSVARAEQLAAGAGARVVSYDQLPAGAEIVIVATPPSAHTADVLRALDGGAAVIVEKPLCRTLAEADELIERGGRRVLYAENLAYAPLIGELLRQAYELGPLDHVEVRALQGLPDWGEFTSDEWGGGALFDLGAHPVAIALLLLAEEPVSVSCVLRGDPAAGHRTDVHAELTIELADGRRARVESSWAATHQLWDVQASSSIGVVRAEVFPTPSLERDGEPIGWPSRSGVEPAVLEQAGYLGQLESFVADLAEDRRPVMDLGFARRVLELICAAYASAGDDGEPVALPFEGRRDATPLELWRRSSR